MKLFSTTIILSALLGLYACHTKPLVSSVEESHYVVNTNPIDSNIYKTISPYKKTYDEQMTKIIAHAEGAFLKADVESTLGNLFCDAVMIETKKLLGKDSAMLDVAVFNKGGLRNSLPKGNITIGNIFELMPFDNEVVLLKLSGPQFKDMLDKIVEKGGIPVGGMRMTINGTKATDVTVNGKAFDETKNYWVVTSDYLANGGDNYSFFKNALEKKPMNVLLRNMMINYCNYMSLDRGLPLKPYLDGRISVSK